MTAWLRQIPKWVWAAIIVLAAYQPVSYLWIAYFPPTGTVPTGLRERDSAVYLECMHTFDPEFESPYVTCKAPPNTRILGMFPAIYGVLGIGARAMGLKDALCLSLVNGLGTAMYLLAVYWFLRMAVPKQADLAFLLFSLSGGPAGALYVATGVLGLHNAPAFEAYFQRFALYELLEGPRLLPVLHQPRIYYTAALALCLGGFAAYIAVRNANSRKRDFLAATLLLMGTFLNFRVGVFACGIGALHVWAGGSTSSRDWFRATTVFLLPVAAGGLMGWVLFSAHPVVTDNLLQVGNMAMWFSPFVSAALLHLFVIPRTVAAGIQGLPRTARNCAFAAVGYLGAFACLFVGHQAYYGNLFVGGDATAPNLISDWALIGAAAGLVYAAVRPSRAALHAEHGWVVLWFLVFLSVAISAFGQGWFLRFGPQRMMVLLWLPTCMLSAVGLGQLRATRPRLALGMTIALAICGVTSITVSCLCFQGPLGYTPGWSPFAQLHTEVMSPADARSMEYIGEGTVLAPAPASDVIAYQRRNHVVFGVGSFNLSDQPFIEMRDAVNRFFSSKMADTARRAFVKEWCVDYVYCPDTWPVDHEVVDQLRGAPWLSEVAHEDRAVVFKVIRE